MKEDKNQKNQATVSKSIEKVAKVMAKATLAYDFSYKEFMEYYKMHIVKECKQAKPRATVVEISARTGIDRRFVAPYIMAEEAKLKPSKVDLIFEDVKAICQKKDTFLIPKIEDKQSFEVVCRKHANGSLTPKSIFIELFRQGKLRDSGEYYELMKPKHNANRLEKAAKGMRKVSKQLVDSVADQDWD